MQFKWLQIFCLCAAIQFQFIEGNPNPYPTTTHANPRNPSSYGSGMGTHNYGNNENRQHTEAASSPYDQDATNNQGTQHQHIETNTYPHNSQGSYNQGTQQQHIETTTYSHSSQGSNNQGSHSTDHICTRTTERYDCQFQNVHLKEGNTSVFGSQDLNTQQRLTFVDSSLEYLPKSLIDAFPNVIMLNLNDLKIASIQSNALERAEKLQSMFVANNRLFQIDPYAFSGANNLQILVLSNNEIKLIDNLAFNSNTGLHYLYLDQNQLDKLPSFTNNVKLQFLNASHNKLSLIDDGHFRQLKNLHTLDLSFNRLGRLNLQQLNAYHLELVDVSSNDLTDFVMPTYVITLNARNNSLREFAAGQQCTLKNVDLSRNKLETQPKFKNCGSLEHLDLSHNLLEEFVYNESMEKLQTINLAHNNLFDIQLKIKTKTKTFAPSLKNLDLSHNELTHISSLDIFQNLELLLLNNNKLITFNKVFKSFPNAIKMAMANNEWNCDDIKYFESKTQDKNYNGCPEEQENKNGICCTSYSKPYNDRLNEVLREADFHKRANQKKCPEPESAKDNQMTILDEIRNAMTNAGAEKAGKLKEIENVTTQQNNLKATLQKSQNKLYRLTNSKVNVAREIENQRKSHRVTKEGLISDKDMLARIIKFVQERDAFNKDLLSRRQNDTEESNNLHGEKQQKVVKLREDIETLKNTVTFLKKQEKEQKNYKDKLEKQWNKNSASIHGGSGTIGG